MCFAGEKENLVNVTLGRDLMVVGQDPIVVYSSNLAAVCVYV